MHKRKGEKALDEKNRLSKGAGEYRNDKKVNDGWLVKKEKMNENRRRIKKKCYRSKMRECEEGQTKEKNAKEMLGATKE